MAGYDWEAIKASVILSDVASRYLTLKKKGHEFSAICPIHSEKTPSFTLNDEKGKYYCFGCGAHGDAVDLVMAIEGCDHAEAVRKVVGDDFEVAPERKIQISEQRQKRDDDQKRNKEQVIAESRRRWDAAQEAPTSHGYLMAKGVQPHMARMEGKWLLIPVYDDKGEIQSVQRIAPERDDKGKFLKLFPKDGTMKGGRLYFGINTGISIICEGFSTGASIYEAVPERVCVAFSALGVEDMARNLHAMGLRIAIAADRKAITQMLKLGDELGCPVFLPSDPHEDFNDMSQAEGPEAVSEIFAGRACEKVAAKPEPTNDDENDDPVNLWSKNEPPQLPKGLLPPLIERFARIRAESIGGDPGGLAMSALAICSTVITDRIRLKVKRNENWHECARLWVMLIGDPSYKKSPIMKAAAGKISQMDGAMLRQYNKDFNDWKERGEQGDMPVPKRLRIEDTTMEAAQEVCVHSPDGILALQDELSGWFGGIEKYAGGKGSAKDRSFWLRAYGGGEYAVNRVSRKSILIDNLSINILGGIQPDAIRRVMSDSTDDGLIQRFMPVVLAPAGTGSEEEAPDVAMEYDALIERLHAMEPPAAFLGDIALVFDDGAQQIRSRLEKDHHAMVQSMERVNKKLASHLGKYDGLFPRLCVVWHCIENVNAAVLPAEISTGTAERVATFLHSYVMKHSMAFYAGILGLSEDQEVIQDIAGYILAHKVETISLRTFQRGSTRMRKLTRFQVEPICQQLEAFGWVTEIKSRGDGFSATVNPRVHQLYDERADDERDRRQRTVAMLRKMVNE